MSYIKFDKTQLINLEYSLKREVLITNSLGAYLNTTILGCNTRKYHGLLVCPIDDIDNENHVMLSNIDETIYKDKFDFNLSIHRYEGCYSPKGHKYAESFEVYPIPAITYRVGDSLLKKEFLLCENENRLLIKYTILDSSEITVLKLKPFLAFRNFHKLSKSNLFINNKYTNIKNGIAVKMYDLYKNIFIQFSKNTEYIHVPDWYYNVNYLEEQDRGYDYKEDLYVPGFFEVSLKKGESVILSAGFDEINPTSLKTKFNSELKKQIEVKTLKDCLRKSAEQFIVKKNKNTEIIAGYPWFGSWGRDTFISLPGLTLAVDNPEACRNILNSMSKTLKDGLFVNMGYSYNSVDAPLWYFWSIQKYAEYTKSYTDIWKTYGKYMKQILHSYKNGTKYNIRMHDNYLIYSGEVGKALTWMDAIVDGKPVTPRMGYDVEINALWYNAICFSLELAKKSKDKEFEEEWSDLPDKIKESFRYTFWDEDRGYLADYVINDYKDFAVRPNQVFAVSLPYSTLNSFQRRSIINIVYEEIFTLKGLRTLSPKNKNYKAIYEGNQPERDSSYHQGTVWPWLIGHFLEAYIEIYKKDGEKLAKEVIKSLEEDIDIYGVGSISEIYDANPPHLPRGTISQAWSVAEILRIMNLIKYKN